MSFGKQVLANDILYLRNAGAHTVKGGWALAGVSSCRGGWGHPFPQLQLDAGEWPVIAVAWDRQQASSLRLFLTFRIATEQGDMSGKNS